MFSFFTNLSKKEKIGLTIAVAFVSFAFLDRLVVSPIKNRIQQVNREIKITERELGRDLRNLNQKDAVSEEHSEIIKYVKKVGSDEEEVAKILGEIEELTRNSSVYLVDMKPQASKRVDFYKEYTVEIETEGEMESVVNFLCQLNNSTQLLRAEKIRINLKGKDSSTVKATVLITKLSIP